MRNVSINPKTLQVEAQQLGVENIITLLAFILDIRIKIIALFQQTIRQLSKLKLRMDWS